MSNPYLQKTFVNFLSFFLIAFSLYVFISLVSYTEADSGFFNKNSLGVVENLGGPFGALISDILITIFGFTSYLVLLVGVVWSVQSIFFDGLDQSRVKVIIRLFSFLVFVACTCSLFEYFVSNNAGGYTGYYVFGFISSVFGYVGSLIFLILFLILVTSITFNFSWLNFLDTTGKYVLILINKIKDFIFLLLKQIINLFKLALGNYKNFVNRLKEANKEKKLENNKKKTPNIIESKLDEKAQDKKSNQDVVFKQSEIKEVESSNQEELKPTPKAQMPSTQLLDRALDDGESLTKDELNELAVLLENKLEEFGIIAEVESVLPGPVVTRFEIQPAPGTKASKITNIAQDIARSLSVSSVRVVEVIEGKSVVGIEIPNTNRKMVRLT